MRDNRQNAGITVKDIYIVRNDDKTLEVMLFSDVGTPYDLTDCQLRLTAKDKIDGVKKIQKSSQNPDEINIVAPMTGKFEVYFVPSDTTLVTVETNWVYDIELITKTGKNHTIIAGMIYILLDIS